MACQALLAKLVLLLVTKVMVISSTASSRDISEEVCYTKHFNGKCSTGLIVVTSARYGRIRAESHCLKSNADIGCYNDALKQVESWCSGRKNCSFLVADLNQYYTPCSDLDRISYLDITYKCEHAYMAENENCNTGKNITLNITNKLLTVSNMMAKFYKKGTSVCPLSINAPPGQQIRVYLRNFKRNTNQDGQNSHYFQCAVIKDSRNRIETIACESQESRSVVYTSWASQIQVEIIFKPEVYFFLEFEAFGCTDDPGWPHVNGLWVKRVGDNAVAKCNSTQQKWTKTCVNGNWKGNFGNCTGSPRSQSTPTQNKAPQESFPFGILIVVAVGVALGVFLGGLLLICAARVIKRRQLPNTNNPDVQYAPTSEYVPREDLQQYTTADQKCTLTGGNTTAHGYKTCHTGVHTCTNTTLDRDKIQQCYGTLPPGYHCSPTVLRSYGHYYDTDTTTIDGPRDPV